jgi:hypothetical protein
MTGYITRNILAVPIIRPGSNPPHILGVIEALNSETGFDISDEKLLTSMAVQVADRLIPELIQDMVETGESDDHEGVDAGEVKRLQGV